MSDKTIYDLSDEEYQRYENDPYSEESEEITDNTIDDSYEMIFEEEDEY